MEYDKFCAWGIDTMSVEGHGLLGRYWGFKSSHLNIPQHMKGCRFAMFPTRKEAREAAADVRIPYTPFPKARAVKLLVTVDISPA